MADGQLPLSSDRAIAARAELILKSFNTWSFKREQPDTPAVLNRVIDDCVRAQAPVSFVLYWGKGPRDATAAPDLICLDFLRTMADRVRAVHRPGAHFELLLTDTHARLNGHDRASIDAYFSQVDSAAAVRTFTTRRLSSIVPPARPGINMAPVLKRDVPAELTESAAKWYRGPGTAADGAAVYYAMNMVERRAVERAYQRSIFVTFNNSRMRYLFPEHMPIFYMYSLRKGIAVKPWFMDGDASNATPLRSRDAVVAGFAD